jgi:hypothetical protein
MFGHGWEHAEGTIIDSRIVKFVPVGPGFNESAVHEYVVEVRLTDGETFRTTVEQGRSSIPTRAPSSA